MMWLIGLMGVCVAGFIVTGIVLELIPRPLPSRAVRWLKSGVLVNVAIYALALTGLLLGSANAVLAAEPISAVKDLSQGVGLALIGIGLSTGLAAVGAGLALGPVGSAALAVLAEKPELFGRTLIYLGLAEGIAIYGLVMSILMLGKL